MKKIVSSPQKAARSAVSILHDREFILSSKTPFPITEEYKTLRTNIMFSIPSEGCKIIGMTSAQSMDGKSINCLNLAITVAQTNARVLLIDADLRLPKIARLLDMDAIPGISNVLVGLSSVRESVKASAYPGLDVLLSGDIPPNPSELLGSGTMGKLLGELGKNYDYIFLDMPPVNVVSDAVAMSKYLSGVILVVRAGLSDRENVTKAINQLEFVDATLLGILLNGVQSGAGRKYSKYSKYRKYRKNGQEGQYKQYGH